MFSCGILEQIWHWLRWSKESGFVFNAENFGQWKLLYNNSFIIDQFWNPKCNMSVLNEKLYHDIPSAICLYWMRNSISWFCTWCKQFTYIYIFNDQLQYTISATRFKEKPNSRRTWINHGHCICVKWEIICSSWHDEDPYIFELTQWF